MPYTEMIFHATFYIKDPENPVHLQNIDKQISKLREEKLLNHEATLGSLRFLILGLPLAHFPPTDLEAQQWCSHTLLNVVLNSLTLEEKAQLLLSEKNPIFGTAALFPSLFLNILNACRIIYDLNRKLYAHGFKRILEAHTEKALEFNLLPELHEHLIHLNIKSTPKPLPITKPSPYSYASPEYKSLYTFFGTPDVVEKTVITAIQLESSAPSSPK